MLLTVLLFVCTATILAQDTVFNRVVTVERDYQPELLDAHAISTQPVFIQHEPEYNPVVYSTYSEPLSVAYNVQNLPAWPTKFRAVEVLNGYLDGSIGHRNTHIVFGYELLQRKNNSLQLYAKHNAYWGKDALSESMVGAEYTRHLSKTELYVGIEGQHEAYVQPSVSWRNLCTGNAVVGFRSLSNNPVQFRVQAGYTAFALSGMAIEHHAKSHLDVWWTDQRHSAGLRGYVQNTGYTLLDSYSKEVSPRHSIRLEPFYSYVDNHIRLHAGVNLDMNIGTGTMLSTIDNLSFAPSPNVEFEWSALKKLLHVYANAKGSYGFGSIEEYMGYNRYLNLRQGLDSVFPRSYTPIDVQLGIKLRPIKTLLVDLYGGYAYMKNACNMKAFVQGDALDYHLWYSDYQYWKTGATLHYHYRDIVEVSVSGNNYFWNRTSYDRPDWDLHARVDVHVNSQISTYSDNRFAGARIVATSTGDKEIKPMVNLNIGAQYDCNKQLSVYMELSDYLNRKDEIFYGYKSQGIHFLLGVKYRF